MPVHTESAFESAIEAHLLASGWLQGAASSYRRDVGLDTAILFEFIGATQIKAWNRLVALHGGADQAQAKGAKRLASEIDSRGTIDVLRRGIDDLGVKIRLAFFKPAHALTAELGVLYDANRLVVTRQVHHSESNPHDSIDILLLLNGLPISTVEVKNQVTGQTVEHAKAQYRKGPQSQGPPVRQAHRGALRRGSGPGVLTTRLAGEATAFLPFNQGSGGAGRTGGTELASSRFAVIVDEAHSSQSGESAKDLKVVLGGDRTVEGTLDDALWDAAEKFDAAAEEAGDPQDALNASVDALARSAALRGKQDNLSFFAFTATPKFKTLELFGERIPDPALESGYRLEPFHLYSMRQAIEEQFILDVLANYVTYYDLLPVGQRACLR